MTLFDEFRGLRVRPLCRRLHQVPPLPSSFTIWNQLGLRVDCAGACASISIPRIESVRNFVRGEPPAHPRSHSSVRSLQPPAPQPTAIRPPHLHAAPMRSSPATPMRALGIPLPISDLSKRMERLWSLAGATHPDRPPR